MLARLPNVGHREQQKGSGHSGTTVGRRESGDTLPQDTHILSRPPSFSPACPSFSLPCSFVHLHAPVSAAAAVDRHPTRRDAASANAQKDAHVHESQRGRRKKAGRMDGEGRMGLMQHLLSCPPWLPLSVAGVLLSRRLTCTSQFAANRRNLTDRTTPTSSTRHTNGREEGSQGGRGG